MILNIECPVCGEKFDLNEVSTCPKCELVLQTDYSNARHAFRVAISNKMRNGRKFEAIKLYKKYSGYDLKESKDIVELAMELIS